MQPAELIPLTEEQIAAHIKHALEIWGREVTAQDVRDIGQPDEMWMNNLYQCAVHYLDDQDSFGALHLSIKRRDKRPIHDWRHLQQIKNDVAGDSREALELYPSEDRRVDTANQYHLWVMPVGKQIGIGWQHGRFVHEDTGQTNAKQRKFSA